MNRIVDVALGERAYRIMIGRGLLDSLPDFLERRTVSRIAVVTNPTVERLYLRPVQQALRKTGVTIVTIVVPDGEANKTIATWSEVHEQLLRAGLDRKSAVLALGGGIVGDIAGFAAATYQRGIDL